jgi:hypothetical protein
MDIPSLVFGSLGIVATIIVGAFGFQASTPGEFWLARSLFFVSALLLAATVFAVQWMTDHPISLGRILATGFVGFLIFAGLASCLDWVNGKEKETAARKEPGVVSPSTPNESKSESTLTPKYDVQTDFGNAARVMPGEPRNRAEVDRAEKTKTLQPPIIVFRDGRAQVSFSVNYHTEPADAPLAVLNFGEPSRVTELLSPRVTSIVFAALEPLSLAEVRARRADLEGGIEERLRMEFKKMGITIDSFSFGAIKAR